MSFSGSNLQNVKWGTHVDLYQGNPNPGTTITAFKITVQPSGTPNQQWRFMPTQGGNNLFTIQSVFDGNYASISGAADVGKPILSGPTAMVWEIKNLNGYGYPNISVGVPNTTLVWSLASGDDAAKVTLAKSDGTTQQQWIPRSTLPPN